MKADIISNVYICNDDDTNGKCGKPYYQKHGWICGVKTSYLVVYNLENEQQEVQKKCSHDRSV